MSLKNVINEDLANKKQSEADLSNRKSIIIESINELNRKLQNWFSDYKNDGILEFNTINKPFYLQGVGSFNVSELHLCFANGKEIVIQPDEVITNKAQTLYFQVFCKNHNSYGSLFISKSKNKNSYNDWNLENPSGSLEVFSLEKYYLESAFEFWFKNK